MGLNIAFYGAGDAAQPYLNALAHRPDVMVTAVCDPERRAAEQTAAGWGAKVFFRAEDMLQEVRPDALWICVAPSLQDDVVLKAIELKIPFFIEPPGAPDYPRAKLLGRKVEEAGLVSAVGFSSRYADILREAREYLGANPVPLALAWWLSPSHEAAAATAERLLWTDACRFVDALRYFCGEVQQVRALAARAGGTEGGLVVQLEFANGPVGILACTTFARPEPRRELEFLGEGWSLSFGENLSALRLAERDKITILRCLNVPTTDYTTAFLVAVEARDPSAITASYPDAIRTLAVCHAAALSARAGRTVALAEVEQ
jgi:predicted dehydrogenase